MDPNAAWRELVAALESGDRAHLLDAASALAGWLDRGGFPPDTSSGAVTNPEWHRRIARHACRVAIEMASRAA
jgi:hypothetical protein